MPKTPVRPAPAHARIARLLVGTATALALLACAVSQAPATKAVYDFGPATGASGSATTPAAAPLALAEVQASQALDSTAVQFRLAYANSQELRPYALARWSMPPAQLVQQRLRHALATRGPVLAEGAGLPAYTLRLELEEFSQVFDAPGASQGVVHLRATLLKGHELTAQRSFHARIAAPSADASGGVRAMTDATDAVALQLVQWLALTAR